MDKMRVEAHMPESKYFSIVHRSYILKCPYIYEPLSYSKLKVLILSLTKRLN